MDEWACTRGPPPAMLARRPHPSLALAACLTALTACASWKPLPLPARDLTPQLAALESASVDERLDNGLRLVLAPDDHAALAQLDVRVEAGARDDPPGKGGLAHVVEHMTFEYADGDADAVTLGERLEALSLYHNAYTSADVTHYTTTGLAADVERLLALEVARLRADCEALDAARFTRELTVVANELRQRAGDREQYLERALTAAAFPEGHPYRDPPADDELELAAITQADVCAFVRSRYTPANITVVITGGFDPARVRAIARRQFGALRRASAAPRSALRGHSDAAAPRRRSVRAAVDRAGVAVIADIPDDPDTLEPSPALHIALELLERELHELARARAEIADTRLALLGGAGSRKLALYAATAGDRDDELRAVERALTELLDAFAGDDDDGALEHARKRVLLATLRRASQQQTRGALLANLARGGESLRERADALGETPASSLPRWRGQPRDVVWLRPSGEDPTPRAAPRFLAELDAPGERDPIVDGGARLDARARWSPALREFTLDNGMRVILAPTAGLPLVDLRLIFDVGSIDAPREQPALARLVADWITPYRSGMAGELYNTYFDAGADATRATATETTEFRVVGLTSELDHLVAGLSTFTADGVFSEEHVEGERKVLRAQLGRRDVEGRVRAELELNAAVFGDAHPYARRREPAPAQLDALTEAALRRFKRTHYRAASASLIIAGRFSPALAEAHIRARFDRDSLSRRLERWDHAPARGPRPPVDGAQTRPRHLGLAEDDATQTTIYAALPIPSLADGQHGARLVMIELLSEAVGRLREQLGASYGFRAYLEGDAGPASVTIQGQVDPRRAGEALRVLAESLEGARADATHEGRFARARRAVLRRLLADAGDPTTLASQLAFTLRHELPRDYFATLAGEVARLQPSELAELTRVELDRARLSTLCIGARDDVETAYREAGVDAIHWVE